MRRREGEENEEHSRRLMGVEEVDWERFDVWLLDDEEETSAPSEASEEASVGRKKIEQRGDEQGPSPLGGERKKR